MTSSLVGSEMCIRDRFAGRRMGAGWPAGPAGWRWLGGRQAERGIIAVSYTHLTLPTICSV
eukprot:3300109-Prorocentrum_lima.AAC.1